MKLISCHIENYGAFQKEDFDFNEGLTVFCRANGYGKTTLASFLKAMLYGLDTDRATNKDFNDRRRFYPFDGGRFGGSLTFTAGGHTYRVERYFHEKSEPRDELTIYRDGTLVERPERPLGEEILGIDRESFERTVFITAKEVEISSTETINTKLNNFVEGGSDDANLGTALAKLDERSKLYAKRSGLIATEQQHLLELQNRIADLERIKAALPQKYRALEEAEEEVRSCSASISAAQNTNVVLRDWEQYDTAVRDADRAQEKIREIEGRYPSGLPTAEELTAARESLQREQMLEAKSARKLFSEEDVAALHALQAQFAGGVPSNADLERAGRSIDAVNAAATELQHLGRAGLTEREGKLKQRFAYHTPSERDIASLDALTEECRAVEREYNALPDYTLAPVVDRAPASKGGKKLYLLLLAVAALLLVGGIVTVFFQTIAGIVLIALGVVALAADGFLYLNGKSAGSAQARMVQTENPEKRKKAQQLGEITGRLQAFLAPYGYSLENGVPYAVKSLKEDLAAYSALVEREKDTGQAYGELSARLCEQTARLEEFFGRYKILGDNFVVRLARLRADIASYKSLLERKQSSEADEQTLMAESAESRRRIAVFCRKYGLDVRFVAEGIQQIETDRVELKNARTLYDEQRSRAAELKREKSLSVRPAAESADLEVLNARRDEAQDKKNALTTVVLSDEGEIEALDDLKNECAAARERLDEYKSRQALLEKAMNSLKAADRKLKDKYVKPIKDRFVHYSAPLERALGEKVTMDPNFEIRFERSGKERSDKHLSTGQRSLIALAFRLALIDNMYGDEKPFLILDDPFVSLDEEHLAKVKTLLAELSGNMQIVYFTCHKSRHL